MRRSKRPPITRHVEDMPMACGPLPIECRNGERGFITASPEQVQPARVLQPEQQPALLLVLRPYRVQ